MATDPNRRDDPARDALHGQPMFRGWKHLQRSLGVSLHGSVKRSRKLAKAQLRRKG